MPILNNLQHNYQHVLTQIDTACRQARRSRQDVQLLAVSKTQSSDQIRELYQYGQRDFAENYLQEAIQKIESLHDLAIEWHFIGHVQRNKTKQLAAHFAWVQGVDRVLIAERLSQQRLSELPPLNICIQVNIDQESSKDGCHIDELPALVEQISQLDRIRLRGLMIIPAPDHHQAFTTTQEIFEKMKSYHRQPHDWDTLSMGMSGDMQCAIAAGSTMVRIGTALFGQRVSHFRG